MARHLLTNPRGSIVHRAVLSMAYCLLATTPVRCRQSRVPYNTSDQALIGALIGAFVFLVKLLFRHFPSFCPPSASRCPFPPHPAPSSS
ncbi:hypothetical protein LZ30DRAFT_325135 [Colletotrichum cereale]|nr:hypothetical protein LZ30DRAFT_325135 [Colletotrichum cereale]